MRFKKGDYVRIKYDISEDFDNVKYEYKVKDLIGRVIMIHRNCFYPIMIEFINIKTKPNTLNFTKDELKKLTKDEMMVEML